MASFIAIPKQVVFFYLSQLGTKVCVLIKNCCKLVQLHTLWHHHAFSQSCDLKYSMPLFYMGQPMMLQVKLSKPQPLQNHTYKSSINFLFYFVFAKCCSSFHDTAICQTNSIFAEASFIFYIFIHPFLHFLNIDILVTKLKMFFPLVFPKQYLTLLVQVVHANSSQHFAVNMMSWWSLIDIISTQTFFHQFVQSYKAKNVNLAYHLKVKSWKSSYSFQSTQS